MLVAVIQNLGHYSKISQGTGKIDNFRLDPWYVLTLENLNRRLDLSEMGAICDGITPGDFHYHVYVKHLLLNKYVILAFSNINLFLCIVFYIFIKITYYITPLLFFSLLYQ